MLWRESLVMRDVETGSLWSHLLGECMRGRLKDKTLESVPSQMTDWKTWKATHPNTTVVVLRRTADVFTRDVYQEDPAAFLLGYVVSRKARAWKFTDLRTRRAVNDSLGDHLLLIVFEPESGTALIYDRRVGDRALEFTWRDGRLVDDQTGTTWDWSTGRATSGQLEAKELVPLPGVVSFVEAWKRFHAESTYWTPPRN